MFEKLNNTWQGFLDTVSKTTNIEEISKFFTHVMGLGIKKMEDALIDLANSRSNSGKFKTRDEILREAKIALAKEGLTTLFFAVGAGAPLSPSLLSTFPDGDGSLNLFLALASHANRL